MSLAVGILGEAWEAPFARATARSLDRWLPEGARVIVPGPLAGEVAAVTSRPCVELPEPPGFAEFPDLRRRVVAACADGDLLLLAAGALPSREQPLERLGAAWGSERAVEWIPRAGSGAETLLHFAPPPHAPPARPRHLRRQEGSLEVVEVDGGAGYFQGLAALQASPDAGPARALWRQYGPRRPVFTRNTNDFGETPPPAHDDYCILGSGLLGLRMVVESRPAAGARVFIYDINPDQLTWIRTVLEAAGEVEELAAVEDLLAARDPGIAVREVQPHEEANARRQAEWFRRHRGSLATLAREFEWHFVICDLLTDPAPLLERLAPSRSVFFMYLDLFMVWHLSGAAGWVEDHAGMAASCERLLRSRAGKRVTFLPGAASARFQLQPGSPFAVPFAAGTRGAA
jgi:hypothetical protein